MSAIIGASAEEELVGVRRDDDFLGEQLEDVGERLAEAREQTEERHAVRAAAQLHPADDLALPEREERDAEDQNDRDDQDPHASCGRCPAGMPRPLRVFAASISMSPRACGLRGFFAVREHGAPAHRSGTWGHRRRCCAGWSARFPPDHVPASVGRRRMSRRCADERRQLLPDILRGLIVETGQAERDCRARAGSSRPDAPPRRERPRRSSSASTPSRFT